MSQSSDTSEPIHPRQHFEVIKAAQGLLTTLLEREEASGDNMPTVITVYDSRGNSISKKPVFELYAKVPKGWSGKYFGAGTDVLKLIAPIDRDDPDQVMRLISITPTGELAPHPKTLIPLVEQQPIMSNTLTPEAPTDAKILTQPEAEGLLADIVEIHALQQPLDLGD